MPEEKNPVKLRMVFMGTSFFANEILKSLAEKGHNLVAVYTQPDKPSGRNGKIKKDSVKETAENNSVPVIQPKKFDEEEIEKFRSLKPDIAVVASYGKILPKEVLEIPVFGCLNAHASLLPELRGPSPVQNALLQGKKETGTTIMLMDEGVDSGDILSQKKIAIAPEETYSDIYPKLAKISAELLLETIPLWIEKKIKPVPQDASRATLCQLIEKSDGKIVWNDSTRDIYNRFRAFCPWPGIYSYWENNGFNLRVKLNNIAPWKIRPPKEKYPGKIFLAEGKTGVATGDGAVEIKEIQLEGKSSVPASDFVNGHPKFIGSILK